MSAQLDAALHTIMRNCAERVLIPHFRSLRPDQIMEKAADDLVTVADRLAEEMLSEELAKLDPGLAIVGEEAASADASVMERLGGDCWIIDPIDGTHNYAHAKPPFGILIARTQGGLAQNGWIYDPLTQRFCSAERGHGAWCDDMEITARASGKSPPVAAISLLFLDPAGREAIRENIAPHYELVDIPRCCAEQYPRIAQGKNDVALFEKTMPWDHAAAGLWLEEAGGKVARPDGSTYRVDDWDRTGLIAAATAELWEGLAERVAALR